MRGPELSVPGGKVPGMAVTPRATDPNDLGTYFVERVIAHRHPEGYWLWAVDQPTFIP
jgi:hypothetical protein